MNQGRACLSSLSTPTKAADEAGTDEHHAWSALRLAEKFENSASVFLYWRAEGSEQRAEGRGQREGFIKFIKGREGRVQSFKECRV